MKNMALSLLKRLTFSHILKNILVLIILLTPLYVFHLNSIVVDYFSQKNNPETLDYRQQPVTIVNMLLLTEDQLFFKHPGVDFKEISRVVRDYLLHDKPLRGASTLTQQLVKNALLTRERLLGRKIKEIIMALLLEVSFDKDFILSYYMDTVYLGQNGKHAVHGFINGAQFYFNNKIENLSLEEMATLVALVKGPSYYHPIKHPQRLAKRRQLVLSLYHKYEKIVK